MVRFAGVELSDESIQNARKWFANNAQGCIDEVSNGKVNINDIDKYIQWRKQQIVDALAGNIDHTLTFLQRAYFIQTGECVALLP